MLTELYDALKDAGAADEKARAAAEAVADYERVNAELRSDLRLLKWMVGANFAATMAILIHAFFR